MSQGIQPQGYPAPAVAGQTQLPAHLANRPKRGLVDSALHGLGGNNPPHVSIRQNRFRLVNAAGQEWLIEQHHLDLVIVDVNPNVSKIYYADAYDPMATDFKPPTCWSDNGPETTGVAQTPSAQAAVPQSPTCALCPHAQWGSETSRVSGKPTKACNDLKKVAVIVPMDPTKTVYLLRVPPATLKNFRNYGKLVGEQGVDLPDLVTRVTFDQQVQGILNFAPAGWIDEATALWIDQVIATKATEGLVGKTDRPRADVPAIAATPAPAPLQQTPPPPQAPPAAFVAPQAPPQQFATPPATFAAPSVPQPPAEPPKRRRRTKAEIEAAAQGVPVPAGVPPAAPSTAVPQFMQAQQQSPMPAPGPAPQNFGAPPQAAAPPNLEIPAFLQRNPQPEASKPVFGMQQAEAPPDDITAKLDAAFALPTG